MKLVSDEVKNFANDLFDRFRYAYIDYEDDRSMTISAFFDECNFEDLGASKALRFSQVSNRAGTTMSIFYDQEMDVEIEVRDNTIDFGAKIIMKPDTGGEYCLVCGL